LEEIYKQWDSLHKLGKVKISLQLWEYLENPSIITSHPTSPITRSKNSNIL
jgi:hypothetical protein